MNFRVYLWNLTVPYLYSPPLMQSSNKHNYALIFTYLKYNLCNSKKKKWIPNLLGLMLFFFLGLFPHCADECLQKLLRKFGRLSL